MASTKKFLLDTASSSFTLKRIIASCFCIICFSYVHAQMQGNLDVENRAVDGIHFAIRGVHNGNNTGMTNKIGVLGLSEGSGNNWNIGVSGQANGSGGSQVGVNGYALTNAGGFQAGVVGEADAFMNAGSGTHVGTVGQLFNATTADKRYAIQGYVDGSATANNNEVWAGYFQGNVCVLGTVYHNGLSGSHNNNARPIKSSGSVLDNIAKINLYKVTNQKRIGTDVKIDVDPENLQKVFPGLVREFDRFIHPDSKVDTKSLSSTVKGVDYDGLIPVLIKGMQEQQELIEQLKAELENVKERLD